MCAFYNYSKSCFISHNQGPMVCHTLHQSLPYLIWVNPVHKHFVNMGTLHIAMGYNVLYRVFFTAPLK